ncbi:MAG: aminopeptidase C [Tenuifilaceae bacterium]
MINFKRLITVAFVSVILIIESGYLYSQDSGSGYSFTMLKQIKTTPVKNQQNTGTCWSFATTSYFETELLRMGQPEFDLSEMFFVRYAYIDKANLYVRYQGTNNFGQGGQAHDVVNVMRKYGMATEESFSSLNYGTTEHSHSELESVLKAMIDVYVKNPNGKLTTAWLPAVESVIDTYFGKVPTEIAFNGKKYSPKSLFESTGLNLDNYIEITSFNHLPFYQNVILEVPDNWHRDKYFNLPLDEMMAIIENALMKGYSVCWDGDVSERGFAYKKGVAIVPASKAEDLTGSDMSRWTEKSDSDRKSQMFAFDGPVPEIFVNQENRQMNFDNQTSTDDHLMHLTGIAKDQNGTKYFYTKNSWGTESHLYNGFFYMSEQYVRMKTIAILIHKDAIPTEIASKMGIIKYR